MKVDVPVHGNFLLAAAKEGSALCYHYYYDLSGWDRKVVYSSSLLLLHDALLYHCIAGLQISADIAVIVGRKSLD